MNKYLLMLGYLCFSGIVHAVEVDLFVNNSSEFAPYKSTELVVRIHDLSTPEQLGREYLPELPPDPELAKQKTMAFFESPRGKEYVHRMKEAYQFKTLLMRYNIQKTPAMVFEGRAVIYGITDIERGYEIYQQYLREQSNEK